RTTRAARRRSGDTQRRRSTRRLDPEQGLAYERPDRREVVAALLDDDSRYAEPTEDAPRLAVPRRARLERALGIAGGSVDTERNDERRRLGCPRRELADRIEPSLVARSGSEREVAVRAGAGLAGEADEMWKPARPGVDVY